MEPPGAFSFQDEPAGAAQTGAEAGAAMQDDRVFIHEIRAADHVLTRVNDAWLDFARENGCSQLTRANVLGRVLFDMIQGEEVRQLYMAILDSLLQSPRVIELAYRCDAPDRRRFLRMRIEPGADGAVCFKNRIEREEAREPVALVDPRAPRGNGLLGICSVCKKLRCADSWLEVEAGIRALGLFEAESLPQLTHTLCPECYAVARAAL